MDLNLFHQVCARIHAICEYSRRVPNNHVGLPNGVTYSIEQKIEALSKQVWNERTQDGRNVVDVLNYILHQGSDDNLPERLWEGISKPQWRIRLLGLSSLGEIVGWALPDIFPPRNGRTSKALRSLGIDVRIHV